MSLPIKDVERFLTKFDPDPMGCWIWKDSKSRAGYAQFFTQGRRPVAHRVSYELFVGPIPEGLDLDHLCRNTSCVRPTHLEPVTRRENLVRGTGFIAVNAQKSHCLNGHEFSPENTEIVRGSERRCITCRRNRDMKSYFNRGRDRRRQRRAEGRQSY